MLEAVGNTPITATVAKSQPVQESATAQQVPGKQQVGQFAKSRIRVDNLLDRAILELRAKDTGEVIQQYPTEQQIKAFDRASELQSRPASSDDVALQSDDAQAGAGGFSQTAVSDTGVATAAPAQESAKSAEVSVPQATAQTQLSVNVASSGVGSSSTTSSTQSIDV